jgi:RNase H-fold protein (predicted Holliday junction resolvase)
MTILSIDIGQKNLGYSIFKENNLSFGLKTIEHSSCIDRCKFIYEFIKEISPTLLIVEKQIITNVWAMGIMNSVITAGLSLNCEVVLFDPKLKFNLLKEPYSTENRKHKKLIVNMTKNFIQNCHENLYEYFNSFKKKDDISDSIMQLFTYLFNKGSLNITLKDFREKLGL